MDYTLRRIPFTESALPEVQDFECGDEAWELEVTAALKDPTALAAWVRDGTAEAWLYMTEQGDLVGFSSISERSWRYPHPKKSQHRPISVIPDVAIHRDFQGKPGIPGVKQYSDQILDHLRFVAEGHTERTPLLGLMVHPENKRAIRWYEKAGFVRLDGDWKHPDTGVTYWRMILGLTTINETQAADDDAQRHQ